MRRTTGIVAVIGLLLVLLSMTSRYLNLLPHRERNTILVIGFTIMFLATLWRVVTDMNRPDENEP